MSNSNFMCNVWDILEKKDKLSGERFTIEKIDPRPKRPAVVEDANLCDKCDKAFLVSENGAEACLYHFRKSVPSCLHGRVLTLMFRGFRGLSRLRRVGRLGRPERRRKGLGVPSQTTGILVSMQWDDVGQGDVGLQDGKALGPRRPGTWSTLLAGRRSWRESTDQWERTGRLEIDGLPESMSSWKTMPTSG